MVAEQDHDLKQLIIDRLPSLRAYVQTITPAPLRPVISSDDLYQDFCAAVLDSVQRYLPGSVALIEPWLKSIAKNRVYEAIKRHNAHKRGGAAKRVSGTFPSSLGDLLTKARGGGATPSSEVRLHERKALLESAMQGLRDNRRQLVQLRFIEGLSYREIGSRCDMTPNAASAETSRAVRELAEILGVEASDIFSDVD